MNRHQEKRKVEVPLFREFNRGNSSCRGCLRRKATDLASLTSRGGERFELAGRRSKNSSFSEVCRNELRLKLSRWIRPLKSLEKIRGNPTLESRENGL